LDQNRWLTWASFNQRLANISRWFRAAGRVTAPHLAAGTLAGHLETRWSTGSWRWQRQV